MRATTEGTSNVDPDALYNTITHELQADLERLNESVERYRQEHLRRAEDARGSDDDAALERARESRQALQRLELAAAHIASSLAYLVGIGVAPQDHNEIREIAARVLESLETERQRLYREVHDGPAQVLTNAMFELEFFERIADRAPADVRAQLLSEITNLRAQLRNSIESVRSMIFDLRPPALAQLGLAEAMRAYAAEFQARYGLAVETDLRDGPTGLSPEQELALYRVLQEALQNVQKHSGARSVRVAWGRQGGRWALAISDDGVGFDIVRATRQSKHFGLLTMRERAEVIGAAFEVRSAPGAGTSITMTVPVAA